VALRAIQAVKCSCRLSQVFENRNFKKKFDFPGPLKQRPEDSQADGESEHDRKSRIDEFGLPPRSKMRTQQAERGGMIIEDHNLSDRFAVRRDMSGLDREDFFPRSLRPMPDFIGSHCHQLLLTRLRTEISENLMIGAGKP
jgi:hypothetical protein